MIQLPTRQWLMPLLVALVAAAVAPACAESSQGPGQAPPELPGNRACEDDDACDPGELCLKPTGACDKKGKCEQRPEACTAIFDPVCGCDGRTYGNECEAWRAGVSVASEGECTNGGAACATNADCGATEYCAKPEGQCDGDGGACQDRPEVCTQVFDPVCGCDAQTYSNACDAAAAGVNVASQGECTSGAM
jgi:hypothetical protein